MNTTTKQPRRMARPPYAGGGEMINSDRNAITATEQHPDAPAEKRVTKSSLVLELLHGAGGTSLAVIVEATGWQPHTARAFLTGLRKKGHVIIRGKIDGVARYSIQTTVGQ
jgi:hypothetical protein